MFLNLDSFLSPFTPHAKTMTKLFHLCMLYSYTEIDEGTSKHSQKTGLKHKFNFLELFSYSMYVP